MRAEKNSIFQTGGDANAVVLRGGVQTFVHHDRWLWHILKIEGVKLIFMLLNV